MSSIFYQFYTGKLSDFAKLKDISLVDDQAAVAIILIEDPVINLARSLKDTDTVELLSKWEEAVEGLLNIHRAARRRIILINPACVTEPNSQEASLLAQILGSESRTIDQKLLPQDKPAAIALICAAFFINANQKLNTLANEIRVASIGGLRNLDMQFIAREALFLKQDQEKELMRKTLILQNEALKETNERTVRLDHDNQQLKSNQIVLETFRQKNQNLEKKLEFIDAELSKLRDEANELRYINRFSAMLKLQNEDQGSWQAFFAEHDLIKSAVPYDQPEQVIPEFMDIAKNWTTQMQAGQAGERTGDRIISRHMRGHVFYGPYDILEPGGYVVDFTLFLSSEKTTKGLILEVLGQEDVIGKGEISLRCGQNRFLFPFYIPSLLGETKCEIRLYSPGKSEISLTSTHIEASSVFMS